MNLIPNNNWLIALDTIDSTNNYAMSLIQDGMAQNGHVVTAKYQTQGKGQRGNVWQGNKAENIAMSMILDQTILKDIYHLSFAVPVAVAEVLQELLPNCQVCIKWTNDIYVNNKKLAGILIENIFRGAQLRNAVLGIGINVLQTNIDPQKVSSFISLKQLTNEAVDMQLIIQNIRTRILKIMQFDLAKLQEQYNEKLWKHDEWYLFKIEANQQDIKAKIVGVNEHFQLVLSEGGQEQAYHFGTITWLHTSQ